MEKKADDYLNVKRGTVRNECYEVEELEEERRMEGGNKVI
jgi:hypothetical protein